MVVVISQHLCICLSLRDVSQMYVTHVYFLPDVFQEGPLNHVENNRNKRLLFDALNQCSLLRGGVYAWGKEIIRMLYVFQD